MHIVIMGCGRVGSRLARSLHKRGHSLAVIDSNVEAFRRLGAHFAGRTVKGVGFDRDVLIAAGIEQADGFAAVSSGDNSNILAARVVRESFGIENVVARIYDPGRAEVYARLGIPTVATVRWASDQVLRQLLPEGSEPAWRDAAGRVRLTAATLHSGWVGRPLADAQAATGAPLPFLLRDGSGMVPSPATLLQEGDLVFAAVETERSAAVEAILGAPPRNMSTTPETH